MSGSNEVRAVVAFLKSLFQKRVESFCAKLPLKRNFVLDTELLELRRRLELLPFLGGKDGLSFSSDFREIIRIRKEHTAARFLLQTCPERRVWELPFLDFGCLSVDGNCRNKVPDNCFWPSTPDFGNFREFQDNRRNQSRRDRTQCEITPAFERR